MVGRKILSSLFRIVGNEAIQIYRSSSALHLDPKKLIELEDVDVELDTLEKQTEEQTEVEEKKEEEEKAAEVEPEIIHPEPEIKQDIEKIEELKDEDVQEKTVATRGIKQKLTASIANTLNSFIEGSMHLWDKIASRDKVLKAFDKRGYQIQELKGIQQLPIDVVDDVAKHYISQGEWMCAAEGAATGMGGIFLLAADAVSLLALQLRIIQQIGYSYGFDVTKPEEKIFAAKLLSEAYLHPAKKERESLIQEMRMAAKLVRGGGPLGLIRQRLFIQGSAKIAEKIGIRMGGRKISQFVPVIGAVAGGVINKKVTGDVVRIAQEVYRDRLLNIKSKSEKANTSA